MINIVYYGTGKFAATVLETIAKSDVFKILAVITQPDKKADRKREISISPVKEISERFGFKIYQPDSLKNFETIELPQADIALVAEYGLIIPGRLINQPKRGTINLHASLLPKYRGASPIQEALKNGDVKTGVTLMVVDKQMDHGPLIAQTEAFIEPDETQSEIFAKLAGAAAALLLDKAPLWLEGKIVAKEQNHEQATFTKLISRDNGRLDFKLKAKQIYDLWRAYYPWPGIWADTSKGRLKFIKVVTADKSNLNPAQIEFDNNRIFVGCGSQTSIEVLELQEESKKPMPAKLFINGHQAMNGQILNQYEI